MTNEKRLAAALKWIERALWDYDIISGECPGDVEMLEGAAELLEWPVCHVCGETKPESQMKSVQIEAASWGYHGGSPAEYDYVCDSCNEPREPDYDEEDRWRHKRGC